MLALLFPMNLTDLLKTDRRSDVIHRKSIMTEAKALCRNLALITTDRITTVGLLDCRLVLFPFHKKNDFEATDFKSIDEIVSAFHNSV